VQGLLSHLAVSAFYGGLFEALVWSVLARFSSNRNFDLNGGSHKVVCLLLKEQLVILLVAASPLGGWGWNLWCGTGWIVFRATILVS